MQSFPDVKHLNLTYCVFLETSLRSFLLFYSTEKVCSKLHKHNTYLTRQSKICSDCPSAAQGNPGSLFADISLLSEDCDFHFRNSARYSIVKKVQNSSFENKCPWRLLKDCSIDGIALKHKNSIILCKEFTSNMATEVLAGTGEGEEKKCVLNDG